MAKTLEDWFQSVRHNRYAENISDEEKAWKLWNDERLRAQTDLFWLAKYILGYDLVDNFYCPNHPLIMSDDEGTCSECGEPLQLYPGGVPDDAGFICSPHRLMCNFFVKKDPRKSIASQDTEKNRLIMMPRGSFKSSVDAADVVQWIICFPNVRIILLTAGDDLSTDFVSNVKKFFTVTEDDIEEKRFTRFQLLFPEHCVLDKDKGANDRFFTPARTNDRLKDPTLRALSLVGETSGKHADIGKYDDCVSNRNSGPSSTSEQREIVRKNIELARSLVEPYGYHDNIGTPYDEDDAYAYQLDHSTIGVDLKFLRRSAWEVKASSKKTKVEDLTQSDYHFLFPVYWRKKDDGEAEEIPCLTYGFLRKKQNDDPLNFACFPAGSPVLLDNWTEKSIEDLKVGDGIVGYSIEGKRRFVKAIVQHVHSEISEVWKVTTDSGRIFYTTPDHKFLRPNKKRYGTLAIGKSIVPTHTSIIPTSEQEKIDLAWMGGIIDGEGTCMTGCVQITQSLEKNPEVCNKIELVLNRLNIPFTIWENPEHGVHKRARIYTLLGGRSIKIRLLQYAQMAKTKRFVKSLWASPYRVGEYGKNGQEVITSIESVGNQTVYNIQSSSGNFVCQGVAVKNCQYLCRPSASKIVKITEQMVSSHIIQATSLPQDYDCYTAWDLAWSTEKGRDYSVGSVGWFDKTTGCGYVVDIRRGRFSKSELPYQIAYQAFKWKAQRIRIEKSPGAEFIENDVVRELIKLGYECPIDFIPVDTTKGAKEARVEMLENLLIADKMWFSAEINIMKEVTKELVNFKPSSKRKDDIPDSVAHLMAMLPDRIETPQDEEKQQSILKDILIQKQMYELIYPDPPPPAPEPPPQPLKDYEGLPVYQNWDEYYGYGS